MSRIICFGEVLWDLLPSGPVAGGAPMNVAFQLNQLGVPAGMISRVGNDDLGRELTELLMDKEVPLQLLQIDPVKHTGIVKVTLSAQGQPSYEIVEDMAWDHIAQNADMLDAIANADFFVFGSLVARNQVSYDTLFACLDVAKKRVFDINLRKPFYSKELVHALLQKSDIVKMNDDELDVLADWFGLDGGQNVQMQLIQDLYGMESLVVTRGANGAIVLDANGFHSNTGYQVTVNDTIGSGDAFFAGYLAKMLEGASIDICLDFGCKMGAFVATKKGGTPTLTLQEVQEYF
jgi:fructokinase